MKGILIDGGPVYDYDGVCYGYRPQEPIEPIAHHHTDAHYPSWVELCDEGLTEIYPCDHSIKDEILSEISNPDNDAIIMCGHGSWKQFNIRYISPEHGSMWEYIYWSDIKEAMKSRDPYKLVALYSCYAMSKATKETISYQLTNGYSHGTAVVGSDNTGNYEMYVTPEILYNPMINGSSVWLSYWNVIEKYGVSPSRLKFIGDYSYTPHHQDNLDTTDLYCDGDIQQMERPIINIDTFNKTDFIGPKVVLITRKGDEYYPAEISYLETDAPHKTTRILLPQEFKPTISTDIVEFCVYDYEEDESVYCTNLTVYPKSTQPESKSILPVALASAAVISIIYIIKR